MEFKYAYTRLLVTNFKACFEFYRDVMEFKPTFGSENDVYADFSTGTVTLALFSKALMSNAIGTAHLPTEASAQDKVCLIFEVEDVDAAWKALNQKGVSMAGSPADRPDWGLRSAYLRDPDGNLIEIYQALKGT